MFNTTLEFKKNNPFLKMAQENQEKSMQFIKEHFAPMAEVIEKQKAFAEKVKESFKPMIDFNQEIIDTNKEIQKSMTQEFASQTKKALEVSQAVSESYTSLLKTSFEEIVSEGTKQAEKVTKTTARKATV